MRRYIAALLAFVAMLLAHAPEAWAHATLVKAEPADGAVIAQAPAVLRLSFNEPVSPLALRLIGPDGGAIALGAVSAENMGVTVAAPPLGQGTHLLSWRVISADGHPVGGSLMFSVGHPSAQRPESAAAVSDPLVRSALWAAKLAIYVGLFVGIGGAFFGAWIAEPGTRPAEPWVLAALAAGLVATPLSVGLQGLDALDLPVSALARKAVWETGLDTSYGLTAIAAAFALFAGLFALAAKSPRLARGLALAGLLGVGVSLALSGHAANAAPRLVNRPAVFLHGVCIAFWIGSLLPLLAAMRAPSHASLTRFSRVIPVPLALIAATGVWLAIVQLGRLDALWSTDYGSVLFRKLVVVAVLLGLAAANRYWLVPRFTAQGAAARLLRLSIAVEVVLVIAILALVALWRFTPPPRSLAAANAVSIHVHGEKAMAQIEIERDGAGAAKASVLVLDGAFRPLAVKEVTLVLANPGAGIEPIRRDAARAGESSWRIDDLRVPVAGRWNVRVEILVSDFEKVMLDDAVALPRLP